MITTHKINIDLQRVHPAYVVPVMQDDKYSRNIEFTVKENGAEWPIPDGTTAVIRFRKPDGTGGNYDVLPNGDAAYTMPSIDGNTVTVALAPQVCTVPGIVKLSVCLVNGDAELNTFAINLHVQKNPGLSVHSENYYKIAGSVADSGWTPNMYLGTDEEGRVVAKELEATGVSSAEKKLILSLLKSAAYTEDVSAKVSELEALWSVSYKVSYSLTGVSASNNASAVVEGGAYSSTLTAEGGYTLTGATVKITMGGVDITSEVYSGGVITIAEVTGNIVITVVAAEIPSYSVTNDLTGVTTDNSASKVSEGGYYSATLTVDDGYVLSSLVITMGGVDVTSDVYGEGSILITEVTGNVVITAVAEQPVVIPTTVAGKADNFFAYSDGGNTSIGTVYYQEKTVNTNVIAAEDSKVMVTIKNETEDAMDIGTLYFGSRSPEQTIKLGICALHYAEAKTLSTLAAGESVTYEAQVRAGYLFAVGHQTTATITVTGNVVDAVPTVSEYAVNDAVLVATNNFYSDGTTDNKISTQYNKQRKETTEAFAEDTDVIITIIGGGQLPYSYIGCVATNKAADMFYVETLSASNAGFSATLPYQTRYTVRAGYHLAVPGNATNVYVQKA